MSKDQPALSIVVDYAIKTVFVLVVWWGLAQMVEAMNRNTAGLAALQRKVEGPACTHGADLALTPIVKTGGVR